MGAALLGLWALLQGLQFLAKFSPFSQNPSVARPAKAPRILLVLQLILPSFSTFQGSRGSWGPIQEPRASGAPCSVPTSSVF